MSIMILVVRLFVVVTAVFALVGFHNNQTVVVAIESQQDASYSFVSPLSSSSSSSFSCRQDHPDFVGHLPGYPYLLPSAWCSGYLDYNFQNHIVHTHYILVEAHGSIHVGSTSNAGGGSKGRSTTSSSNNNNNKNKKNAAKQKETDYRTESVVTNDKNKYSSDNDDDSNGPPDDDDDDNDHDDDRNTIPLIYWSNGGPGASSLFGLLTELGPFLFSDQSLATEEYFSTGIPTPIYNPRSWSHLGHLLVFDQPAPVGFSYCDNDIYGNYSCSGLGWTDELAANNTFHALQAFYQRFPEFQNTTLFLTGESYAGIYIPTLARQILQYNQQQVLQQQQKQQEQDSREQGDDPTMESVLTSLPIPLEGFAVGDACLGTHTDICGNINPSNNSDVAGFDIWSVLFMAGHGQIPLSTLRRVMKACHVEMNQDDDDDDSQMKDSRTMRQQQVNQQSTLGTATSTTTATSTSECAQALQEVNTEVGGYYAYNLYDDCTYRNGLLLQKLQHQQQQEQKERQTSSHLFRSRRTRSTTNTKTTTTAIDGSLNDYSCGGDIVMEHYLKLDVVQKALHVHDNYYSVDNAVNFNYTPTEPDLTTFYRQVKGQVRVLVYNGDADPAITSLAAQNWTSKLGFMVRESWRPWTVDGCRRMGGYVTRYENNFDFVTVRGAGHMVPTNKADASYTFIKSWIQNEEYPQFDPQCILPHDSRI